MVIDFRSGKYKPIFQFNTQFEEFWDIVEQRIGNHRKDEIARLPPVSDRREEWLSQL